MGTHNVVDACSQVAQNWREWSKDYEYNPSSNEYNHLKAGSYEEILVSAKLSL